MTFFEELKRRNVVKVAILYGVASWLTLQVAGLLFEALDLPNTWLRLVLALLVLGFPLALVFAWVFEITPEGIRRESDIDRSRSVTADSGRRLNLLIVTLLVIAIGAVAVDRLLPEAGRGNAPELAIAVLPFVDMSPSKDQEYLTDGLAEELLNLLAKVPKFRVAGRTSSFAFKNRNEDLREIGAKLGVGVLLEGSVRKDGDNIRVTAQLIKADDGYHLWSETYDRRLQNIFALQDDIAREVVGELKNTLLGESDDANADAQINRGRPTTNQEAYASYLRGKLLITRRSYDDLFQALDEFKRAIDLDPDFAEAHAGLALAYLDIVGYRYRSIDDFGPLAGAAIARALELDPDLSDAWAARGMLLVESGQFEDATTAFERAVALNPNNAAALVELAERYFFMDRNEESERLMQRAYDVDPLSPVVIGSLAIQYRVKGDVATSDRLVEELAALDDNTGFLYRIRSRVARVDGDFVGTVKWLHRAVVGNDRDVFSRLDLAAELIRVGAIEAAERRAREAFELAPESPRALVRVADTLQYQQHYYEALGMIDEALHKYPNDDLLKSYRITVLHHAQRFEEARAEIAALAPTLNTSPPTIRGQYAFFWAPRFAWLQRLAGASPTADELHRAFLDFLRPDISYAPAGGKHGIYARWAAATGDAAKLVAELNALSETDTEGAWDLFQDPMVASYAGAPGFDEVAARFAAISARNRQALADEGVL